MDNSQNLPVPFNEKGMVLILQKRDFIPSSGNIAYFLDRKDTLSELFRKGVWSINDSFFYPFSGKECRLIGEKDISGKIQVQELEIIGEGYLMVKNEHLLPKTFEAIEGLPSYSLSESISIQMVKNLLSPYDSEATRLFLRISFGKESNIYIRASLQMLELFFDQRINLEELIRLREDDLIYAESPIGNDIKAIVTYSKLTERLGSLVWKTLCFPTISQEDKDKILGKLKSLTKNGIIGIYKYLQ
jgi:hypothetical protein